VPQELLGRPAYTGMLCHRDNQGGYAVWLPKDWNQFPLKRNLHGFLFSPYKDDLNTSILIEKRKLKYKTTEKDMPFLREAFQQGILALPGAEIESQDEDFSKTINVFDARFTYLDGEIRRKRWVRNIYWGEGQLILVAQGKDVETFEYWLPMFYNTMVTAELV
jgi:hypothetical protein